MLSETLEKVRLRWETEGLVPVSPLNAEHLNSAFATLRLEQTEELIQVYSALNGFDDLRMDSECFAFWSLDKMAEENVKGDCVRDRSFVYFADFLIFSHTYAFAQNESPFVTVYCHYGADYIVKIADSFEEFFEYYLNTDRKLWPS